MTRSSLTSGAAPRWRLNVLALTVFAASLGVPTIPGALPYLLAARALTEADIGNAGLAFGLVFMAAAPAAAFLTRRVPPYLLAGAGLAVYAAGMALTALAPGWPLFLAGRVLHAVGVACCNPQVTVMAARLAGAAGRSAALAHVFTGLVVGSLVGAPLANAVSVALGPGVALALPGALGLAMAVVMVATRAGEVPADGTGAAAEPAPSGRGRADRALAGVTHWAPAVFVLATALVEGTSSTMLSTFQSPVMTALLGVDGTALSGLLLVTGLAGIAGNWALGRLADRLGAARCLIAMQVMAVAGLAVVGLAHHVAVMVLGLAIWGFASWGINPPLQSLIVIHGGPRVSLLVAVNASAIYLGMGLGNSLGAAAVNLAGLTGLPWATLAVMALSVATALAARATGKRRTPQTS